MKIKVTSGNMPKVIVNEETLFDGEEMIFVHGEDAFALEGEMFTDEQRAHLEKAQQEAARIHQRVVLRQEQVARELAEHQAQMETQVIEMEKVTKEQFEAAAQEAKAVQLRVEGSANENLMLNAMLKDGLIESKDNYKIKLSDEALRIDGKKQPASVFQKYLKLYEAQYGPQGKFNVTIQRSKN